MNTSQENTQPQPPPPQPSKREHVNRARFIASQYGEEID